MKPWLIIRSQYFQQQNCSFSLNNKIRNHSRLYTEWMYLLIHWNKSQRLPNLRMDQNFCIVTTPILFCLSAQSPLCLWILSDLCPFSLYPALPDMIYIWILPITSHIIPQTGNESTQTHQQVPIGINTRILWLIYKEMCWQ